jgi:hypothetical protein
MELRGADFEFGGGWRIELGAHVSPTDVAVESLKEQLAERHGLTLDTQGAAKIIELAIRPGSVNVGEATDRDKAALAEQAYRLELGPSGIRITANAPPGLFYGVETLVQVVKPERGRLWLPAGQIVDWPDVRLREVFWDEQEHLDHFDVLRQAIRRAAFFKINALTLRLNGHFEYASAPALTDPYALSPAQLQELTSYGLHCHMQVIPYLDGPAHVNFILEHDEYTKLREFPETAFQTCSTNPETYKLLLGMFSGFDGCQQGWEVLPPLDGRSLVHRQGRQRSVSRNRARQATGKPQQVVGGIHAEDCGLLAGSWTRGHFLGRRAVAGRRHSFVAVRIDQRGSV